MSDFKLRALSLIDRVLAGEVNVRQFCARYETMWNFERDHGGLSADEAALFEHLFDVAAWFSPVREDREANPRFTNEAQVIEAVRRVRAQVAR